MKIKQHEKPEFQVIRQNEANAKFFVASFDTVEKNGPVGSESGTGSVANNYTVKGDAQGWF